MLKKHTGAILTLLTLLSILVGIGGCRRELNVQSTVKPISKDNMPRLFNVIGFAGDNKPVLFTHEITWRNEHKNYNSAAEFHKFYGENALCAEECKNSKKYSFYIDTKRREKVEGYLTATLNDNTKSVNIRILEDHPATRKQKVYIDYWNDDFNYYSVYAVDNRSVTPLEYGDLIKSDGIVALGTGLKYMILFYITGRVLFAIAVRRQTKKEH